MSVVVDANVLVALLIADEHQAAASAQVEQWFEAGEQLHAPAVLPYEIANVLARLVFEEAFTQEEVDDIWLDLAAFDLQLHPFALTENGPAIARVTTQLRRRHATASTYVCLAQRLETTLWTLDAALARNASNVGLPVKLID
ncbi:type II toxin-antitoxin system VapC family toxin [Sciscionella marina]|uniref:type II toxin-antitoxin system VapC family toxin n=1 Tax=Sciscionella marina TaxID=508770 RepID=UPI0003651513|nr:type II toxin-antitoxin system VapC family toxin [Sciscionella marina]